MRIKAKKIFVLLTAVVLCLGIFSVNVQAAGYPELFFFSDEDFKDLIVQDKVASGETYIVRMLWYAEYNNEGYDIVVYDSDGNAVATASSTWTNSTLTRRISVRWDTSGRKPGKYTVEVTKKFYSLFRWNEAPTKSHLYLTLECNHNWDSGTVSVEPTATQKGVRTYKCTKCGETKTEEIPEDSIAKAVIDKINALPTSITLDNKAAVQDARTAYNALSEKQKGLITNYSVLEAAEKTIHDLEITTKRPSSPTASSPTASSPTASSPTASSPSANSPAASNKQPANQQTVYQEPITIAKAPSSVKAKAKKNKATVSWKKIKKTKKTKALLSQIKSIQIQVATNPTFTYDVTNKNVGKNKTKISMKLRNKTTYYVRVRYVGSDGVSNWSKVKRVRTK